MTRSSHTPHPSPPLTADDVRSAPWQKVFPWVKGRVSNASPIRFGSVFDIKLLSDYGPIKVATVPMRGRFGGDIVLELKDGDDRGWAYKPGLAEYVGFLWEDQMEVFPWPALCAWWDSVSRGRPGWQKEFAVSSMGDDESGRVFVTVPVHVARVGEMSTLSLRGPDSDPRASSGEKADWQAALELNWRSLSKDLGDWKEKW